MKQKINVLVIEDDEYYNNLLSNAIQQSVNPFLEKGKYQLILRSFTNAGDFVRKIKSGELKCDNFAVFMNYYPGEETTASQIIGLMLELSCDPMVVLLSQSNTMKEKIKQVPHDYFVVKDRFAPALCGLYMQQYIENKYSVSLDA